MAQFSRQTYPSQLRKAESLFRIYVSHPSRYVFNCFRKVNPHTSKKKPHHSILSRVFKVKKREKKRKTLFEEVDRTKERCTRDDSQIDVGTERN